MGFQLPAPDPWPNQIWVLLPYTRSSHFILFFVLFLFLSGLFTFCEMSSFFANNNMSRKKKRGEKYWNYVKLCLSKFDNSLENYYIFYWFGQIYWTISWTNGLATCSWFCENKSRVFVMTNPIVLSCQTPFSKLPGKIVCSRSDRLWSSRRLWKLFYLMLVNWDNTQKSSTWTTGQWLKESSWMHGMSSRLQTTSICVYVDSIIPTELPYSKRPQPSLIHF